jgi:hypothetical protein
VSGSFQRPAIFLADTTNRPDVVYAAKRFRLVMALICGLPESLQENAYLNYGAVACTERDDTARSSLPRNRATKIRISSATSTKPPMEKTST